jgi:hypothetical protein
VCAAFPVGYLLLLGNVSFVFVRYFASIAPFVALFAGYAAVVVGRLVSPRRPLIGLGVIIILVGAGPAVRSVQYDLLRGRTDTRILAGEWIQANVPPGTPITLPNKVRYPNPVLPPDAGRLRLAYGKKLAPELLKRGLGDPRKTYPASYLGFFGAWHGTWQPKPGLVVSAEHPVVGMKTAPQQLDRLRAAGAAPIAKFVGVRGALPPSTLYDPLSADYFPMTGFGAVERPGPTLTIWRVPAPDAEARP